MTLKEAEHIIKSELIHIYPQNEIFSMSKIIFQHILGYSLAQVHLNAQMVIPGKTESQIYNIIHQLKQFKPLQYILGETEFFNLRFEVNESVLIPRPETEELVDWIIHENKGKNNLNVLDIGTGSGCIAISLAKNLKNAVVTAMDISEDALKIAQHNSILNQTNITFIKYDILNIDIPHSGLYDLIVSNPPYVTESQKTEMLPNVLNFEPHLALFTPNDNSLVFYEAIAIFAQKHLKREGVLYFEINEEYFKETSVCIEKYGYKSELKKDLNNKFRMLKAWRNG